MAEVARLFETEFVEDVADEISAEESVFREAVRIAEAIVFASAEPIDDKQIADRLPDGVALDEVMEALREHYQTRGVNLTRVGRKWIFRTASDLSWLLARETEQKKKLTKPALETLAIIAYHQPVTRVEIEDVRGVAISKGTLDALLETGWVRLRGRRRAPGRPVTYGTTEAFLLHFGLEQIGDLPGLDELRGAGLFDGRLPPGFGVPSPKDDLALAENEDPLEDGVVEAEADAESEAEPESDAAAQQIDEARLEAANESDFEA